MHPARLEWEVIVGSLHPLSPRPGESRLVRFCFDIDPSTQQITAIELGLLQEATSTRLRFRDIWLNSLVQADVFLPRPVGSGVLVVDGKAWQWEQPVLVVADDEEHKTVFGASLMEVL